MAKIKPTKDVILAEMVDYGLRIQNGIILPNDDMKESGIRPRWVRVYEVGATYKDDMKKGEWLLVKHGRWTRRFNWEDDARLELVMVDPEAIILIADSPPETVKFEKTFSVVEGDLK